MLSKRGVIGIGGVLGMGHRLNRYDTQSAPKTTLVSTGERAKDAGLDAKAATTSTTCADINA
jgi:hypothetical protein